MRGGRLDTPHAPRERARDLASCKGRVFKRALPVVWGVPQNVFLLLCEEGYFRILWVIVRIAFLDGFCDTVGVGYAGAPCSGEGVLRRASHRAASAPLRSLRTKLLAAPFIIDGYITVAYILAFVGGHSER